MLRIVYLHLSLIWIPVSFISIQLFLLQVIMLNLFYAFHLLILVKNKRIFMIVHVNIRFHE